NQPYKTKPENINLAIDKEGQIFWNESLVQDTPALLEKLKKIAVMVPQPELHIRGDQNTQYKYVGKVILTAQRAGIAKVAFVTEPPPRGG
ncbi:ExbD/TolR family protein, partial [Undibacterium sp.]|uniref:ExbD/TolR family protein n=1 Tax=Undibacterium sp. TaxID=1914977 RepID=UPI00374DF766